MGGTYCIRGIGQDAERTYQATFNVSHICLDAISMQDYASASYFQWAPHCVAGSSGARIDPYVRLPLDSIVVKLGTEATRDDYDAFAPSARVSTAQPGMHDVQPDAQSNLALPYRSLKTELDRLGAKRLFVTGLATDYVVKRTVYNALDVSNNWTVVLLEAATRGIVASASREVYDTVRSLPKGRVLTSVAPTAAMVELCAGTCDADTYTEQCTTDEFCQPVEAFGWGVCTPCGCANGGVCQADGTCSCPFPRAGAQCRGGWGLNVFMMVLVIMVMIFILVLAWPAKKAVERLRGWWHHLSSAKEREQEESEARSVRESCQLELSRNECTFWFVSANLLLESTDKSLPAFAELRRRPGFLVEHTITRKGAYRAAYSKKYLAVSHRWFAKDAPDKDGVQLSKVKEYLRKHRQIQWVWFDFWSMPQGSRTPAQKVAFSHMLSNINWLYLGCSVLVLLDLSYLSRFWTQFEAWLSFQAASTEGLVGVVHQRSGHTSATSPGSFSSEHPAGRCTVVPIYNANSIMASYLQAMWAEKTPQEAHAILSQEDVTVTSMKDKVDQLPKILKLHEDIRDVLYKLSMGVKSDSLDSVSSIDEMSTPLPAEDAEAMVDLARSAYQREMARAESARLRAEEVRREMEEVERQVSVRGTGTASRTSRGTAAVHPSYTS